MICACGCLCLDGGGGGGGSSQDTISDSKSYIFDRLFFATKFAEILVLFHVYPFHTNFMNR